MLNLNTPSIKTGAGLTQADFDGHCQPGEACTDMGDNYDDEAWRANRTDDDNRAAATFWLGYLALCAVGIIAAIVVALP